MELEALLNEHRIPFKRGGEHRNVRHNWVGVDCPWCGTREKFHLGIHCRTLACVCWQCGSHSLYSFFLECCSQDRQQAWALTKAATSAKQAAAVTRWAEDAAPGTLKLPDALRGLCAAHKRYLRDRGFSPKRLVNDWGIQGIGLSARYAWRLFIPIHYQGSIVSWTTRAIGDGNEPKYLNAPPSDEAMPAKRLLYGEDFATNAIVVVEGPADAWRIGHGAVAVLGVNVSLSQIKRISRYPVRAICFDNESRAQRRAQQLATSLSLLPGVTMNVNLDSADPGSASVKEIKRLRKHVFGE